MAPPADEKPLPGSTSLRPASATDGDFLFHVYASTREEEMAAWGWSEAQRSSFLRMQYEVRTRGYSAAYPSAETSVILFGDAPAGLLILSRAPGEIRLVDIALLPQFRNRGLGEYLIRMLPSEAARTKSVVRLSVLRGNRAAHLYERLGFKAIGGDAMYCEMECAPARLQARASVVNESQESIPNAGKSE
jgi:ribosomal protein S18 acetylase RimI-like enzyme